MRLKPSAAHRSETGASAVEYAILVSLIAASIFATVLTFGGRVGALFESVLGAF